MEAKPLAAPPDPRPSCRGPPGASIGLASTEFRERRSSNPEKEREAEQVEVTRRCLAEGERNGTRGVGVGGTGSKRGQVTGNRTLLGYRTGIAYRVLQPLLGDWEEIDRWEEAEWESGG